MQLGILNIVQAMELPTELVYPLYVAASSDWYFLFLSNLILRNLMCLGFVLGSWMSFLPFVIFEQITSASLFLFESQESIVKRGEELQKKNASGVNLEDADLVSKLFVLFNGMIYITLSVHQ